MEEKKEENKPQPEQPQPQEQPKPITVKEAIMILSGRMNELEQKLLQQQQIIESLTASVQQYQQVMDQLSNMLQNLQNLSGSGGESGLIPLLLRMLTGGGESGSDKLMKMFFAETLKTNLALQRLLLHGIAKGLGVNLKSIGVKTKKKEEEGEEEE
ncbi:MAG: hypothetical protein QXO15_05230 [Nitrososphaerota archaeon]